MTEEEVMQNQQDILENDDVITCFNRIPYFILDEDVSAAARDYYFAEVEKIYKYYQIYEKGKKFLTEGTNGDYIPSTLRFKKAAKLVNKEARFLFANPATFNINMNDVDEDAKNNNTILQNFLDKVLKKNNVYGNLLKAAKDCLIGKRIGIILNFNDNGISVTFLKSTEFIFESSSKGIEDLTRFVAFYSMNDCTNKEDQRWFKKIYSLENEKVYVEEKVYNGIGEELELVTPKLETKLNKIPAAVILNDGLIGDTHGVSELSYVLDYEGTYSKLANGDIDAERKSMNPIKYTIDASQSSTTNLSAAAGSYWDLQSDDDKDNFAQAKAGILENSMSYSPALKTTLDRIENEMYSEVDVPNINSEKLAGVITSGKALKALYWDLTVRCDEKMLAWKFALEHICNCIIEGGILYPNSIYKYSTVPNLPNIEYELEITNNYALPEDEAEEKNLDLAEINSNVMSRKAYLKKWRNLTDKEADDEINQIKMEIDLLENSELSNVIEETNLDDLGDSEDIDE